MAMTSPDPATAMDSIERVQALAPASPRLAIAAAAQSGREVR
jgi:hypothetical protein